FVGKIDQSFSASQSISARFSWDRASVTTPRLIPFFSTETGTKAQFFVAEHKWVASSTLLNVVKLAWNRAYESTTNVENVQVNPALFFIPGTRFGSLGVSGVSDLGPDS